MTGVMVVVNWPLFMAELLAPLFIILLEFDPGNMLFDDGLCWMDKCPPPITGCCNFGRKLFILDIMPVRRADGVMVGMLRGWWGCGVGYVCWCCCICGVARTNGC